MHTGVISHSLQVHARDARMRVNRSDHVRMQHAWIMVICCKATVAGHQGLVFLA
jgi:hypothetical protein